MEDYSVSVTIPYADENADNINDYQIEFGTLSKYYVYDYLKYYDLQKNKDNEIYKFYTQKGRNYFYRVSNLYNNDCVTYGDYIKYNAGEVCVTKNMMYTDIAEDEIDYNKNTVKDDFSVNEYDTADIYLNINQKGHINVNEGEDFTLYPLRNWLAIEGIGNSKVIEPDFHCSVFYIDCDDFLEINENDSYTSSRHSIDIVSKGTGTAVVTVSYDAMTALGMGSEKPIFYSAVSPINTGVFIVTSGINTYDESMVINKGCNNNGKKMSGDNIDAEFDVIYFDGEYGEYTFETDANISVMYPEYENEKLIYNGIFTDEFIKKDNGITYIGNLREGSNIVKAERDGKISYQIIRAKKLEQNISAYRKGEKIPLDNIMSGDIVKIEFNKVYHPANKLSGYYNYNANIDYKDDMGNEIKGLIGQYTFASDTGMQSIEFEIPKEFSGMEYRLINGCIHTSGYGFPIGTHRENKYETGKETVFDSRAGDAYFGKLPDISIPLKTTDTPAPKPTLKPTDAPILIETEYPTKTVVPESEPTTEPTAEPTLIPEPTIKPIPTSESTSTVKPTKKPSSNADSRDTISVTFRLIGATRASGSIDLSRGDYKESEYVNWIKTKTYKLKKGSTVKDLFEKAVGDLDYDMEDDGYISTVYAPEAYGGYKLKEFTNGGRSGWMYTVNGSHTNTSMKDFVLSNSQKVIFHYTNDYLYEVSDLSEGGLKKSDYFEKWLSAKDDEPPNLDEKNEKGNSSLSKRTSAPSLSPTAVPSYAPTLKPTVIPTLNPNNKNNTKDEKIYFDIDKNMWYFKAVKYVSEQGFMGEYSENQFAPDNNITRGMFITVIYRLAGKPYYTEKSGFRDSGKYKDAISWGYENNIVFGRNKDVFGTDEFITREEFVTILYRYAEGKAYTESSKNKAEEYNDFTLVSDYAAEAFKWACASGIIVGSDNNMLMPKKYATRAETAQIIARYCNLRKR